jgi:hypothetical protein
MSPQSFLSVALYEVFEKAFKLSDPDLFDKVCGHFQIILDDAPEGVLPILTRRLETLAPNLMIVCPRTKSKTFCHWFSQFLISRGANSI